MPKLNRLLVFLAATALPIAFLSCLSCGTAEVRYKSPFPATADVEAARVQRLALSVVEVQVLQPTIVFTDGAPRVAPRTAAGTAWVVDVSRSPRARSLVLTNDHVCTLGNGHEDASDVQPPPTAPAAGTAGLVALRGPILIRILTVAGDKLPARVVYSDPKADLCALDVDGIAGPPLQLAAAEPPFGALIERLGDDQGILNVGVAIYSSGRWSGRTTAPDDTTRALISAVATGGASGSPVLYHGRVVAMVEGIPTQPLGTFTWCVTIDDIRDALSKAWPEWLKR